MAKKKATTKKKATSKKAGSSFKSRGAGFKAGDGKGKHLVIVESPSKAKTINKYLGSDYLVMASVGHVRDLPSRNPKGVKAPVPGVDLENGFTPTYEILSGKDNVIKDLKRAAKEVVSTGGQIWFATDLDREGEAIAWHLAQELNVKSKDAQRVVFTAITKAEIARAFDNPLPIDDDKVNAQQARRILDRIVGYQVSPLLWKKVARGLSAGRVQSVAVRLVVEREREIQAFIPDEVWSINANFALSEAEANKLGGQWANLLAARDDKGAGPTIKSLNAWLGENKAIRTELVDVGGEKFNPVVKGADGTGFEKADAQDISANIASVATAAGLTNIKSEIIEQADGRGPARWVRTITGDADPTTPYKISSIETKRTKSRPPAPFITSTIQQAASSRLGFAARRTMRAAQGLYEGVEIPGEGPVGLITYMRTDSTHLAPEAVTMAREFITQAFGSGDLPEKPNYFTSSNKAAQEAHEAIRPASLEYPPARIKGALTADQFKLYTLIWERFIACQMAPAQWDSTTFMITGGKDPAKPLSFRASGRVLAVEGFYKVAGIPNGGEEQHLPALTEDQPLNPFAIEPKQRFTSPPARYSEASLIKMLESEGIGRPSTYADIIQKIQDRKYVEQLQRRFYATDLGEVVTDKLIEAFPRILEVGYTREMEGELDKIEEDHHDWIEMLHKFYNPFKESLERAHEELQHAKAEITPAPDEYRCEECGGSLVYRFGKNGRFLSCARYPDCNYACPCDREGKPRGVETTIIACPKCGSPLNKRTGRFGPFLGCSKYDNKEDPCDGIVKIDKAGKAVAPSPPPLVTDLPCPTCESPLNLRSGVRGPWLGCSKFPKCRGRGKWRELDDKVRTDLENQLAEHDRIHPISTIRTLDGKPLTDSKGKPLPDAPTADALIEGATPTDEPAPPVAV